MSSLDRAAGRLSAIAVATPATSTSTRTGSAVDLQGYEGVVKCILTVGTVSGTTPTLDGKIQSSADGSTGWADVSGATFAQITATAGFASCEFAVGQANRYIRFVGTIAGTTPSFPNAVVAVAAPKYS